MSSLQPTYTLILENKPASPCIVHARELHIDLHQQATTGGPWKTEQYGDVPAIVKPSDIIIKYKCVLCGYERTYKLMTEKTLL
jgi:hypothetical protein